MNTHTMRLYLTWFMTMAIVALLGVCLTVWFTPPAKAQDAAIGDSIAVGTGHALRVSTYAKTSMGSCWILAHMPRTQFDRVVISAGINDAPGPCVGKILATVKARIKVVILPAPINSARASVFRLAQQAGAFPISYSCKGGCTKHNFHPGSYGAVATSVRAIWK